MTTHAMIKAAYAEASVRLDAGERLEIEAAGRVPTFSMVAYTGGPMRLAGFQDPVVVDLTGVRAAAESVAILRDHQPSHPLGHGSIEVRDGRIIASGELSVPSEDREQVVAAAKAGFPWQASIGARVLRAERYRRGQRVTVNGRAFGGPVIVARRVEIREISVLALGADQNTKTRIAAAITDKGHTMTFEEFLESLSIEASAITDEQRADLETAWKIKTGKVGTIAATVTGNTPGGGGEPAVTERDADDLIADIRAKHAAELDRIAKVRELCGDEHPDICAKAVSEGWSEQKTELEILKSGRSTIGIAVRRGSAGEPVNTNVLEAAVLMSLGYDDKEMLAGYDEPVVDQADRIRGMGLKDLCLACARLERLDVPTVFGNGTEVIRAATSTRSLTSIVSNVVSKIAMKIYEAHPIVAFQIGRERTVPDFKSVSSYRLDGTGKWEQVGKDSKLKHGLLEDTGYTNQADTYGQIIGIGRKDIINDDLGILRDIGRLMGQSGAALIDDLLFTLLLANTGSFFSSGNGNLSSGSNSAFGLTGLGTARQIFRKFKAGPGAKDKDKRPINVQPKVLLVPPELETDAEAILNSTSLNLAGTTDSEKPSQNPWRNKYRLAVAPHLSDSTYTGNSATAWFLFADPAIVPALEIAFVNGKRTPTIERVAPPSDVLGLYYRGYLDVGVSFVDPKGAVKSAGV